MAYLKGNKSSNGKTYYRSQIQNSHWSKGYIYIPLKTTDYEIALQRHEEVETFEKAIKRGIKFSFSWEDADNRGRTKIIKLTLNKLVSKFVSTHKTNVRQSTIKRYICAYNSLINVLGKTCPPQSLNNESIELFKKYCVMNNRKNNGINIDLRAIKTLLLWSKR